VGGAGGGRPDGEAHLKGGRQLGARAGRLVCLASPACCAPLVSVSDGCSDGCSDCCPDGCLFAGTSVATATRPSSPSGMITVLIAGVDCAPTLEPPQPTTLTRRGTSTPNSSSRAVSPRAMTSLKHTTAVGSRCRPAARRPPFLPRRTAGWRRHLDVHARFGRGRDYRGLAVARRPGVLRTGEVQQRGVAEVAEVPGGLAHPEQRVDQDAMAARNMPVDEHVLSGRTARSAPRASARRTG